MYLKKYSFILVILSLITTSCTETFYPEYEDNISVLVVDGKITNGIGSCEVRLFRTVKFTDDFDLSPEQDATVILHNDKGKSEILTENEPGIYTNSSLIIKGEVGSSYWIEIETLSGDTFESIPEIMPSAYEINLIYGEGLKSKNIYNLDRDALQLYFDTKNIDNTSTHLRWQYRESYEWHSPYSNPKKVSQNPAQICFPVTNFNNISIHNASSVMVKELDHLPLSIIFDNEVKLQHNYVIDMDLYSITQQCYLFWEMMKDLNQGNGNIYDLIPANIIGNILPCSNNCEVLGYFEASSVRKKQNLFNTTDFSMQFSDFPEECESFTINSKLPPDPTKYKILKVENSGQTKIYTVHRIVCYECNIKYPTNKPSFWH